MPIHNPFPPTGYQTFQLESPRSTHHRRATCEEVRCNEFVNGWRSDIDTSTDLGAMQAEYIRKGSGRKFVETQIGPTMVSFAFEAGQRCFKSDQHTVHNDREPFYVVRDGDTRGNPTGRRREHARAEDWVEHMSEDLDKIRTARERG